MQEDKALFTIDSTANMTYVNKTSNTITKTPHTETRVKVPKKENRLFGLQHWNNGHGDFRFWQDRSYACPPIQLLKP